MRTLQGAIENLRTVSDYSAYQSKINVCTRDLDFWKLTAPELDQSCQNTGTEFTLNGNAVTFEGFVNNLIGTLATVKGEIESHQKRTEETSKLNAKLGNAKEDVVLWKEKVEKMLNKTQKAKSGDLHGLLKELKVKFLTIF